MQYTSSSENYSSSLRDPQHHRNGGKDSKGYVYKKSSYQYSNSGTNNASYGDKSVDKNVDQLDALLEDLKNERQITRERDLLSSPVTYRTIDREKSDPVGFITKTTRVVKTSKQLGGNPVHENIENYSTSDYSTLKSNNYSTLQSSKNITGDVYERNHILENTELIPSTTTTTTTSHLEKDLQDIALSDDILPIPGTKVTTTVRTYTYEIPADTPSNVISNRTHLQKNINYNTIRLNESTNSVLQSHQHPTPSTPQTVMYNTESYSTINKNNELPITTNQSYEVREHRESNTIQNNLLPQPRNPPIGPSGGSTKTIVYNVNTTENVHSMPEPSRFPHSPDRSPHVINVVSQRPIHNSLPPGPTTNRYYYHESSNSVNTVHGPGGSPIEPDNAPHKLLPSGYPPHSEGYPPHNLPSTSTVNYKYSSSTTNTRRGPDFGPPSPSTQLAPFPVDGVDYPITNGSPPQRVDDLMQSFGNTDTVDRSDLSSPHRKREVETAVATPNQQQIPSINKAGKEVYYPPGQEVMITKREEMSAGSAAGGRWAKGSGMYEYESGSKSKTKTKSGGAMVPVCLPLCCAMPCTIM